MDNQDATNQREWDNADNWTMPVGFYFSKKDSRWMVPRKVKWMGWTFNLGHGIGAWAMLLCWMAPLFILIGVMMVIARA